MPTGHIPGTPFNPYVPRWPRGDDARQPQAVANDRVGGEPENGGEALVDYTVEQRRGDRRGRIETNGDEQSEHARLVGADPTRDQAQRSHDIWA
jgi:hypothetical protein